MPRARKTASVTSVVVTKDGNKSSKNLKLSEESLRAEVSKLRKQLLVDIEQGKLNKNLRIQLFKLQSSLNRIVYNKMYQQKQKERELKKQARASRRTVE